MIFAQLAFARVTGALPGCPQLLCLHGPNMQSQAEHTLWTEHHTFLGLPFASRPATTSHECFQQTGTEAPPLTNAYRAILPKTLPMQQTAPAKGDKGSPGTQPQDRENPAMVTRMSAFFL